MPRFAQRLKGLDVSPTIAVTQRARVLRAEGHDVISLSIGEPDFPTPSEAIEAAHAAALSGDTKYPPIVGAPALVSAIQAKFQRENELSFASNEITIANGAKQIIYNAIMATVDQGDEIVIPAPYWVAYELVTRLAGGVPVIVNCPQETGFRLKPEVLEAAITPKTRWVLLNFPNNPTGAAITPVEMAALAEVMRRHPHVWIMCDDIYEHLLYDGFVYRTMAAVAPDLRDRVLTISGVSKSYAMTGWRVGFAGGPPSLIKAMNNMQSQATSGVAGVAQAAAAAALNGDPALLVERAAIYAARRDFVVCALQSAPGLSCHKPEGAFYVFPGVAGLLGRRSAGGRLLQTDEDVALALLEESYLAVVHGAAFGMSPYLRLSYATDEISLARACERLVAFCETVR
ncbi:Aspartate aminotransferase [Granulibacter bethesdensis]|uniref:pyridoxal phosphate-dependent aminotransferase n=1 Tax=Granulibacter bethesdensis TaxID=364410 RepID=UPI00090AC478|nr:pyridoxal phosphate-dependent aminotransferase [Granulibacter bethesdensis]APH56527.1 Aspartate aminotransferase [Granulibacter bethesdensis]